MTQLSTVVRKTSIYTFIIAIFLASISLAKFTSFINVYLLNPNNNRVTIPLAVTVSTTPYYFEIFQYCVCGAHELFRSKTYPFHIVLIPLFSFYCIDFVSEYYDCVYKIEIKNGFYLLKIQFFTKKKVERFVWKILTRGHC